MRLRTSSRTSGRPTCPCRIFQVQKRQNPLRCQAISGRGCDDVQRRAPVPPDLGEENPKHTVGGSQLRPFSGRALKDADLVPESDTLQLQRSALADHRTQRRKESGTPPYLVCATNPSESKNYD